MTTRDRHARVKEVFVAACDRTAADRPAFLDEACGDDEELFREVLSLLKYHDGDDATPGAEPSPLTTTAVPPLVPGTPSTRVTGRFNPGEKFAGRYRIVALLGIGGMGEVYRAHDEVLDVPVALKFITEAKARHREQLLNEVRLARQVTHPSVCRVYDVGQVGQEYFITMEYVDGEDLSALLRRVGRFPSDKLLVVARQLCAGLAAAHAKGVLHQDLKPANILIDETGKLRITDFGIATTLAAARGGQILGTPAYMSPERLAGRAPTVASDLYALGLVLYEMASGQPVFRAATPREYADLHRYAVPRAPSEHIPDDLDPRLEAVILQCLEKDPEKRPASALEAAAALPGSDPLRMAAEAGQTPSPELVARAQSGHEGLHPGIATALLALLTLSLAGLFFSARPAFQLPGAEDLKPPRVLVERAQQILRDLGHHEIGFDDFGEDIDPGDPPLGQAWGFRPDFGAAGEPVVRFWYRQSPFPLMPSYSWRFAYDDPRVTLEDPPPVDEGMVQMILDASGRLMMLIIVPAVLEEDQAPVAETAVDWTAALEAAGFEAREVRPAAASRRVPRTYVDERRAWTGADPRTADSPRVHIDAAAHRGRVVYFSAWPEMNEEFEVMEESVFEAMSGLVIFDVGLILILAAAILVARLNIRSGRGDLRGARNLAIFVVVAKLAYWLLAADHVPSLEDEMMNFHLTLGVVLVEALLVWLAYIALEPTVRRFWPRASISWSRVLRGRWRDPLVGQSLLLGALAGTIWAVLRVVDHLAVGWLGLTPLPEVDAALQLELALSARLLFAHLLTSGLQAVYVGVLGLFLLAVLRLVGKRAWVAVAGFVVVQGLYEMLTAGHPQMALLTLGLLIAGSAAWILVRFGLLTYIAALFVESVLTGLPITSDYAAWFSGAGYFALAVPAVLAGFGAWTALAGRSLVGEWLVPERG